MFLYSYIVIYKNLNRLIWETKETMPENTVMACLFAVSRFVSARGLHNAGKPGDRCPGNKPFPIRQLRRTPGEKLRDIPPQQTMSLCRSVCLCLFFPIRAYTCVCVPVLSIIYILYALDGFLLARQAQKAENRRTARDFSCAYRCAYAYEGTIGTCRTAARYADRKIRT